MQRNRPFAGDQIREQEKKFSLRFELFNMNYQQSIFCFCRVLVNESFAMELWSNCRTAIELPQASADLSLRK